MDSLWGNIFHTKTRRKEHVLSVLKNIPMFSDLSSRELVSIGRILHKRSYAAKEVIFGQGATGVGMYIIVNGRVQIVHQTSDQIIAELSDGEFFGELALLDEAPRSATAVATAQSKMLGFFQSDLFGLTERNPRLGVKIILSLSRIIGKRLVSSNEQVHELHEKLNELGCGDFRQIAKLVEE
jgi:CRP/FNR family cyclic AMP-dependent transcriptional regulator